MVSEAARAVEAMGAELALGQAYGLDKILERVKLERSQAEPVAHDAYHALVFWRARFGILLKILVRLCAREPRARHSRRAPSRCRATACRALLSRRKTAVACPEAWRGLV